MANGSASSVTDAAPEARRARMARRVGAARAAKVASRRSGAMRPGARACITKWLYKSGPAGCQGLGHFFSTQGVGHEGRGTPGLHQAFESIQKRGPPAPRRPGKKDVPVGENRAHAVAGILKLSDALVQDGELRGGDRSYFGAGGAAPVTHLDDARQLIEGEAQGDRPTHQANANAGLGRVFTIAVWRPGRPRQQSLLLVVAEGVRAHAGEPGQLGRSKQARRVVRHGPHLTRWGRPSRGPGSGSSGTDERPRAPRHREW